MAINSAELLHWLHRMNADVFCWHSTLCCTLFIHYKKQEVLFVVDERAGCWRLCS